MTRLLFVTAVFIGLSSWSSLGHFDLRLMHSSHHGAHAEMASETESNECSAGVPVQAATYQDGITVSQGAEKIGLLALAIFVLAAIVASSGIASWPAAPFRWRHYLFKLFDPLHRLLRAGVINRKEYVVA
jgi:hypothetical protein